MGTSLVWSIGDVVCQFEVLPDSHWPFHVRLVHDDGDSVIQDAWVASRDEAMQVALAWLEEEKAAHPPTSIRAASNASDWD